MGDITKQRAVVDRCASVIAQNDVANREAGLFGVGQVLGASIIDEAGTFGRLVDHAAHACGADLIKVRVTLMVRDVDANRNVAHGALPLRASSTSAQARSSGVVIFLLRAEPGTATTELISGEDLAPTFLEAAGVSVPAEMTGRSFVRLLRGEPFEGREYVFAERGAPGQGRPSERVAS